MAAIFCSALFKPCEWLAEGCQKCWTGLCKGCAACFNGCCDCFGACCEKMAECCGSMCAAIGRCCSAWSACCSRVFAKPFSGCVAFGVVANLAPLIACIVFLAGEWKNNCSKPVSEWLVVQLVMFALNIAFAVYMLTRISKMHDEALAEEGAARGTPHAQRSAFERNWQFFMYDTGVCLYIVVALFTFAWSIVGIVWSGSCSGGSKLADAALGMGVFMLVFQFVALVVLCFTLMQDYTKACMDDMCGSICLWKLWFCWCYYPCCYFPNCEENTWKGHPPNRGPPQQPHADRGDHRGGYQAAGQSPSPQHVSVVIGNPQPQPQPQHYQAAAAAGDSPNRWQCPACTFINDGGRTCNACNKARPVNPDPHHQQPGDGTVAVGVLLSAAAGAVGGLLDAAFSPAAAQPQPQPQQQQRVTVQQPQQTYSPPPTYAAAPVGGPVVYASAQPVQPVVLVAQPIAQPPPAYAPQPAVAAAQPVAVAQPQPQPVQAQPQVVVLQGSAQQQPSLGMQAYSAARDAGSAAFGAASRFLSGIGSGNNSNANPNA